MSVRVDFDRGELEAAVRDLARAPEGLARPVGLLARLRAALGQQVHARYRERRGATTGFTPEVAVELTRPIDGFTARVRGRIDGVIDGGGAIAIEEVKSMALDREQLDRITVDAVPDFALQVRLYALAITAAHPGRTVVARLVLVSLIDDGERVLEVDFDAAAVAAALDHLLRELLAGARAARERARRRAAWVHALRFPHDQMRPHQRELIEVFEQGLAAGRPALVEAPTGIGKTISALWAGLRHALASDATLFFATSRTAQQEQVARAFEGLVAASFARGEPRPTAVTLRAKERMCPPGHLLCHPDHCERLRPGAEARAERIAGALIDAQVHVDPDRIYRAADRAGACPFEVSWAVAARAELVIGDHNHAYDGALADAEGARPVVVVADEAHALFDRARAHHSPFVADAALGAALSALQAEYGGAGLGAELADLLTRLGAHIDHVIAAAVAGGRPMCGGCTPIEPDPHCWRELAARGARLLLRRAADDRRRRMARARDPVTAVVRDLHRVAEAVAAPRPERIAFAAAGDGPQGKGIGIQCVNPAAFLEPMHRRARGTLAMSATLSPLPYFAEVLGLAPLDPLTARIGSPFPRRHRRVVIVPTVTTAFARRERHYRTIAETIAAIVAVRPGRYAAFLPSFAFAERVRDHLPDGGAQLLVQIPEMSAPARQALLDRLRASDGPALLLAVMGGALAEGVDLPGDQLIGAIIVGPGLPAPSFERAQMRRYFDGRGRDGFAYAMLYPGMQRVIQSAGRVIRTMDDRGVIALLDERFARPPYAGCLPSDWYERSTDELVAADPAAALADFWQNRGP